MSNELRAMNASESQGDLLSAEGGELAALQSAAGHRVGITTLVHRSLRGRYWLVIPLSILYAFITQREGLASFAYFFVVTSTFLSITLLQTSTYLVTGVPSALFSALEGLPDALIVNAVTVLGMLVMLLGYVFLKPTKFKVEVIVLTALVYLQAYFWFTIMRVIVI